LMTPSPRRGRDSGGAEEQRGRGEKKQRRGGDKEKENAFFIPLFVFLSLAPPLLCSLSVVPPRRGEEMKSAMAPVEDLTRLRSLYRNFSRRIQPI